MQKQKDKNYTLWLTGRPCAGKSTLADALVKRFEQLNIPVARLDGDDVRTGLNADLGFTESDRKENLRRVAHVAKLFNLNQNIVIATFVSPTNELRKLVREIVPDFILCYVNAGIETCESRDVKGHYKKARQGVLKNFTGVSAPFEEPDDAEIVVDTVRDDLKTCVDKILKALGYAS
jgi:adenylylsulfate kinase